MKRFWLFFWGLAMTVFVCCGQNGDSRRYLVDDVPGVGALNAIRNAYQMTDLKFTPVDSFYANPTKIYQAGIEYRGLVYSSVKEKHTFVGMDVSFHTFMTAIHNPRSVIYKENVSKPPYHGRNCGAYYGTVCSGLTTYALGLKVYQTSRDFASSKYFQLVEDQSSKGVRLADVINSGGHVQLVTGIRRNPQNGRAEEIEICEGVRPGCRRVIMSGEELDKLLTQKKRRRKLYRYKYLDSVKYTPLTDFVALGDEKLTPFKYNDDICTSRGDKACFIVGETVTLNIAKGFKIVEVYKDSVLYETINTNEDIDILLTGLPYGDYKARVVNGKKKSDYTYWKVVDVSVKTDSKKNIVSFHSKNALPVYVEFCTLSGGRPSNGIFDLSEEDVRNGYVNVASFSKDLKQRRHVKVHFECDYGRVTNKPLRWK